MTRSRQLPGLERSYRTGDFARRGADGFIYSAGRADDMVKIRGHRFDLGEVEAALRAHPQVREAAAFALKDGEGNAVIRAAVLVGESHRPKQSCSGFASSACPHLPAPSVLRSLRIFRCYPQARSIVRPCGRCLGPGRRGRVRLSGTTS